VTAQRRAQNLQEVPISVAAVGEEQIERVAATNIESLDAMIPNANLEHVGQFPGAASFSIRGVGISGIESFADPAVAVYVNGVYQARNVYALSTTLDVEAIEVLRGPQGTLYGRNALAGAIALRTNKPNMNELGGRAQVDFGNYGRTDIDLIGNLPLVEDKVAMRIAVRQHEFDGFFRNNGITDAAGTFDSALEGKPTSKERYLYVRPSIRFTPTDQWDITFFGDYYRNRSDSFTDINYRYSPRAPLNANCGPVTAANSAQARQLGIGLFCATSASTLAGFPGYAPFGDPKTGDKGDGSDPFSVGQSEQGDPNWVTQYMLTNDTSYQTDIGSIRGVFNYQHATSNIKTDSDGENADLFSSQRWEKYDVYSGELIYVSNFSDRLDLTAGVYYLWDHYKTAQISWNTGTLPAGRPGASAVSGFGDYTPGFDATTPSPPLVYGTNTYKRKTYAIYAQAEYKVVGELSLVVGGRYSWEKKYDARGQGIVSLAANGHTTRPNFEDFVFGSNAAATFGPIEKAWKSFSPRVGLNYKLNDDIFLFTFWQRAFKSGGFNMNAADRAVFELPYGQERVDSYEAGVKADLLDNRLRANVNAYYAKFKGLQRSIIRPDSTGRLPQTITDNAADLLSYGVEFEITAKPMDDLTVYLNGGVNETHYTSFCNDLDGPELTAQPQSGRSVCGSTTQLANGTFLVEADYSDLEPQRAPKYDLSAGFVQDIVTSRGSFSVSGSLSYSSEQATHVLNIARSTRDDLLTIDGSISFKPTSEKYRITVWGRNLNNDVELLNIAGVANLWAFGHPTNPRTYGLTLAANF